MFDLPITFEGIPDQVVEEFVSGRHAKDVMAVMGAKKEQLAIARTFGEHASTDILGKPTMVLSPTVYHAWGKKFGTYDCWNDKDFRKYMHRNFDEVRVRGSGGTRIQSGYTGASKRFSKNYGEF